VSQSMTAHLTDHMRETFSVSGRRARLQLSNISGRVPLDKEKGVVKGEDILSGAEHRFASTSESVGPRLWDITAESLFWWIAPPNHRYEQRLLS
jgi:hypothetical protein